MSSHLREYQIVPDAGRFRIEDQYGEEPMPEKVWATFKAAADAMALQIFEDLQNYDGPPDGDAWSGGFADNH